MTLARWEGVRMPVGRALSLGSGSCREAVKFTSLHFTIRAYRRGPLDKTSLLTRQNFEIQSPELAFPGGVLSPPRMAL
jgi:hypothetical protein